MRRQLLREDAVSAEIIHGDCLDVLREMPDASVDGVVTDPPYASGGRQPASARNIVSKADGRANEDWFLGDNMGADTYRWWMREVGRECLRVSSPASHANVFCDWRQYSTLVEAWESVGWTLRGVVVWDKAKGGAMGSFWRNNHEWVAVFTKGPPRKLPHGSFFNTWTGTKPQGAHHPTEKPIALMRYLVSSHTPSDGTILDPFNGSGTTGVAALMEGHAYIGIEREAAYVEIARQRIADAQAQLALGVA
jgi:site-specific DNA-methyltransferase (adenine-specific)